MRSGSRNHNSSSKLRGQRGGYKQARGGRTSAGGMSECRGVQASTGDGKNERDQVRGVCRGGTNMHGGGCKRARGECGGYERAQGYEHSNDGSGNGGSGIMWPPPPPPSLPLLLFILLVILLVIFTYKYVHNIF